MLPAVFGGFHFDDASLITENPHLVKEQYLSQYSQQNWFRWRLYQSFKNDIRLAGGSISAELMHAMNIINHIQTAVVWALLIGWVLVRLGRSAREQAFVTAVSTGIFLVHPIMSEPVAYVAGRADVLSALFMLTGVLLYCITFVTDASKPKGLVLAFVTYGLSMLMLVWAIFTKESAIIFPVLVLGVWLLAFEKAPQSFQKIKWGLGLPVLLGIGLVVARAVVFGTPGNPDTDRPVDETLATNAWAVINYIWLWFVPYGQSLDHDFTPVESLFTIRFAIALTVIISLMRLAWRWRREEPLYTFGLFLFFLGLAPTTSIIPITDLFVERRMYVPSMGLSLIVAVFFYRRIREARRSGNPRQLRRCQFAVPAVIVLLTLFSLRMGFIWSSDVSVWKNAANRAQFKPRPWRNLGTAYLEAGDPHSAVTAFSRLFELDPKNVPGFVNAAEALRQMNQFDNAWDILNRNVLLLQPNSVEARMNLAMIAEQRGQPERARAMLEDALVHNPDFVPAIVRMGTLAYAEGDSHLAREHFERALRLSPNEIVAHRYLALIYSHDQVDLKRAREHVEQLAHLSAGDPAIRRELAALMIQTGDLAGGFRIFQELAEADPDDATSMLALSQLHARQQNYMAACAWAIRAARVDQLAAEDYLSFCLVPTARQGTQDRDGGMPPG